MPHPFRFGVQLSAMPGDQFADRIHRIEALGYSTVFWPDHWGAQYEPVAALAAAAALTTKLRVGSLVYGVDYRHPIVLAKAAATIQLLSNGRHEFGIGAGWMRTDYDQAGIAYDKPSVRIERLGQARFRLTVEEPIRPDPALASDKEQAVHMMAEVNRLFERWIRERPEQWLCMKRAWPRTLERPTDRGRRAPAPAGAEA